MRTAGLAGERLGLELYCHRGGRLRPESAVVTGLRQVRPLFQPSALSPQGGHVCDGSVKTPDGTETVSRREDKAISRDTF